MRRSTSLPLHSSQQPNPGSAAAASGREETWTVRGRVGLAKGSGAASTCLHHLATVRIEYKCHRVTQYYSFGPHIHVHSDTVRRVISSRSVMPGSSHLGIQGEAASAGLVSASLTAADDVPQTPSHRVGTDLSREVSDLHTTPRPPTVAHSL